MTRQIEADVDPIFPARWSPRAFSERAVAPAMLDALFEAARWAPSSSNHQPWLFLYAATPEHLALFRPILVPANQTWANHAPVLTFLLAQRNDPKGRPNRLYAFDAGAAWMSLALQAHKLGLITHAMGGFEHEKAYAALHVDPAEYEVMCAIAIGHPGDPAVLPPDLREREKPNGRKPHNQVAHAGPLSLHSST